MATQKIAGDQTSQLHEAPALEELTSTGEGLGLEAEGQENGSEIKAPFDPSLIDVITHTRTVDLLLTRLKEGELILDPEFQRRANIWSNARKSGLIESILLRIPLPSLYVSEDKDGVYTVVDGLQRLCAIAHFVNVESLNVAAKVKLEPLQLMGLQALGEYKDAFYKDLPRPLQRRINETELTMHVIRPGTPTDVKFNIFARLNQGGMPLTAQEIRNAIYPGDWKAHVRSLSESENFLRATERKIKKERMDDWELIIRFIAYYELARKGLKRPSIQRLDEFLNQTVKDTKEWSDAKWEIVSAAFEKAMAAAPKVFGKHAFRKYYGYTEYRNPVNRGLFESQSVALAQFSTAELERIGMNSKFVLSKLADQFKNNSDFDRACLSATGSGEASNIRYRTVSEILNEVLDAC